MHWSSAVVPASPEAAAETMLLCTLLKRASREELRQAAWSTSAVSSAAGRAAVPGAGALVVQGIAPLPIPCHVAAPLGLGVARASRLCIMGLWTCTLASSPGLASAPCGGLLVAAHWGGELWRGR